MHRFVQEPGGVTALYVGAENWPFPIPLVSRGGVWRFDADAGSNEIRFRRIGENEVTAIGICHALVAAETHSAAAAEADDLVKTVLPTWTTRTHRFGSTVITSASCRNREAVSLPSPILLSTGPRVS